MRAAWWWIDRWRKSTAYTDMTLAEQGAYRNLLDELWLRDGFIPDSERILGKIAGDVHEWPSVRVVVMARFTKTPKGWTHPTHDEVAAYSQLQASKGKARARGAQRNPDGTFAPAEPAERPAVARPAAVPAGNQPPSPSPSPSKEPNPKEKQPCAAKPARRGVRVRYSAGFKKWWDAYYHRQARGSKSKSFGHWMRDGLEGREDELLAMLPAFIATKDWQRGCQPNAQTFLSGRLWETPPQPERDNGPRPVNVPPGHDCHGHTVPDEWTDAEGVFHRIRSDGMWVRFQDRVPHEQEKVG